MQRYPPSLKSVLALDPSLLNNPAYLSPYPALAGFLNAHPEIAHNPSFYVGEYNDRRGSQQDRPAGALELWRSMIDGTGVFLGFSLVIGVAVWLVRTIVDYRRWNRLTKVQTDVHTRILDRFTDNAELLAYMQSAGGQTVSGIDAGHAGRRSAQRRRAARSDSLVCPGRPGTGGGRYGDGTGERQICGRRRATATGAGRAGHRARRRIRTLGVGFVLDFA